MKKFILTGATLMAFATASFAQNTTTTNQVGTSQKAQVEQYGNQQTSNIQQVQALARPLTSVTTQAPFRTGSSRTELGGH